MLPQHIPVQPRTFTKRLIVLGLAVTIGFSIICGLFLHELRRRDYDQARDSAANVVAAIAADVGRGLDVYDLSLQAVVDGMKLPELGTVTPEVRQLILFDRAATAKDLGSIQVTDQHGNTILDSTDLHPKILNHAERDYFRAHAHQADLGPFVSVPWMSDNGEYMIAISRRISDIDGSFLGVVIGTIRLSYFQNLFKNVTISKGDSIALTHASGLLISRFPYKAKIVLRDLSNSVVFQQTVAEAHGSLEAAGVDGVNRLFVYQRVGGGPLILVYGVDVAAIYAGWQQEALRVGLTIALLCAINVGLIIFLVATLKRAAATKLELAISASTDVLTGLCNRRRFDEIYDQEWRRAYRSQNPLSVIMIDADHFKSYNDSFGHQAGDRALAEIADCLRKGARRSSDVVARYGGEEFIVLLPETNLQQAHEIAERVRAIVLDLQAQQTNCADAIPTISLGVASAIPQADFLPNELCRAADDALYAAKKKGRNRTEISSAIFLTKTKQEFAA